MTSTHIRIQLDASQARIVPLLLPRSDSESADYATAIAEGDAWLLYPRQSLDLSDHLPRDTDSAEPSRYIITVTGDSIFQGFPVLSAAGELSFHPSGKPGVQGIACLEIASNYQRRLALVTVEVELCNPDTFGGASDCKEAGVEDSL